ncbi:putative sulfate exporter family transporter [Pedobacter sp. KR3-3]|uniref:Sulfate exporter family transporter n=1 Tax=Pedobacter albus TaxID=3113905 RepID=A0ABU7IBV5_9SPHI|nr:putative sulfate exporter family transporter [Pedobacter sp. KR3-3]MEE1946644.1 putative sulfate exporter family transporter [Pedobacter sp. KR3-3]
MGLALLCLFPFVSPPLALALGIGLAILLGNPFTSYTHKATHFLLQASVVGLGFGMNIHNAIATGKSAFSFTLLSISITFGLGFLLTKLLRIEKVTAYLVAAGTAICGGSAIAAVAPVVQAKENQTSIALATVFVLNAIALFVFPPLGHWLNLSQSQFGYWCAIAIHDTSSVVGAASKYGPEALTVATTVKLARALWIIPISLLSAFVFKGDTAKIKIPYFIGLFVLAMLLNSYVPQLQAYSHYVTAWAKAGLTLTLFLIGSGLSLTVIRSVGVKPLVLGVILWVVISVVALGVII